MRREDCARTNSGRIQWRLAIFAAFAIIEASREDDDSFHAPSLGVSGGQLAPNLTNEQLATLLRRRGYNVLEFPGESPLVLMGDVAYTPEHVLPELQPDTRTTGQTNIKHRKHLWLNKDGSAHTYYYFEKNGGADKSIFEKAVKSWADSTCIKFTKMADNKCDQKFDHGAVCVGSHNGCWSAIGNLHTYRGHYSQRMSVEPDGCELHAVAHEFGHTLGLQHAMGRPDRDSFIWVNNENFEVPINEADGVEKKTLAHWRQGARCGKGQMFEANAPIPYDYFSLMQYGQSDFTDEDKRIVFAAKNPYYTYMMDYKRSGGYLQTHYDKFIVNTAYKCVDKWTAACKAAGKAHPRCKHNGYLLNTCKCACADGYVGSTCQTRKGKLYPVRDRATVQLWIINEGRYGLENRGMDTKNKNYAKANFVYFQYASLKAKGKPHTITHTHVHVSDEVSNSYTMKAGKFLSYFQDMSENDCLFGMLFYWGLGNHPKMRTECMSTFVRNEPFNESPILRSRDNTLNINIIARIGEVFSYAEFTKWMLEEMKFWYEWLPRPQDHLKVYTRPKGALIEAGGTTVKNADQLIAAAEAAAGHTTTENGTGSGLGGVAAAMVATPQGRAAAAAAGGALLLVVAAVIAGVVIWKKKHPPDSKLGTLKSKLANALNLDSGSGSSSTSDSD